MFTPKNTTTPIKSAESTVKIVASSNGKGGCGKTTISYNLAILWASMGKRVVFIDTDRQAQGATLALGAPSGNDFYNYMVGAQSAQLIEVRPNLLVMPTSEMSVAAEATVASMRKPRTYLRDLLLDPAGIVMAAKPDVIIIDTASQGYLAEMALHAATMIVSPTPLRKADTDGLTTFAGQLREFFPNGSCPQVRIIPNRYDLRTNLSEKFRMEIKNNLAEAAQADPWFAKWRVTISIRESVDMDRAMGVQKAIFEYAPAGDGARSTIEVGTELLRELFA